MIESEMQELINRARELANLREKATPGPWTFYCDGIHEPRVIGNGWVVAACHFLSQQEASNAALIASAPEMAELLEKMAKELEKMAKELEKMAKELEEYDRWAAFHVPDIRY